VRCETPPRYRALRDRGSRRPTDGPARTNQWARRGRISGPLEGLLHRGSKAELWDVWGVGDLQPAGVQSERFQVAEAEGETGGRGKRLPWKSRMRGADFSARAFHARKRESGRHAREKVREVPPLAAGWVCYAGPCAQFDCMEDAKFRGDRSWRSHNSCSGLHIRSSVSNVMASLCQYRNSSTYSIPRQVEHGLLACSNAARNAIMILLGQLLPSKLSQSRYRAEVPLKVESHPAADGCGPSRYQAVTRARQMRLWHATKVPLRAIGPRSSARCGGLGRLTAG
jgi:hypothetical protein